MMLYYFSWAIVFSMYVADTREGCVEEGVVWSNSKGCINRGGNVTCRGLDSLESLEVLPRDMVRLSISESTFEQMNGTLFRNCSLLKKLKIERNSLIRISSEVFRDMNGSLEAISIKDNPKLRLEEKDVFAPLGKSLRTLTILRNGPASERIFEPLTSLKSLHLDRSSTNGSFGETFAGLRSLVKLRLEKLKGNLTNRTLENFGRCRKLILRHAYIYQLEAGAFSSFANLTHLDLSYNRALSLESVLPSLRNTARKIISLRLVNLIGKSRPTSVVKDEFFQVLAGFTELSELYLSKNEILHLWWSVQITPWNLKVFDLSYNRLSNVFYLTAEMFLLGRLETMIINYQSVRYPGPEKKQKDDEDFGYDEEETRFPAGEESQIPGHGRGEGKKSMSESEGDVSTCNGRNHVTCRLPKNPDAGDMDVRSWCFPCPRRLTRIELNGVVNVYLRAMPAILVLGDCPIESVELRHNGFARCGGQLMIDRPRASRPVSIDLGYNRIECLSPDLLEFSLSRNLTLGELNLESNCLSVQLATDKRGMVFHRYLNLSKLNLSDNKLKKLPRKIFINLSNLEILNLSRNSLQVLEFEVTHMTKLSVLDVSENLLASIDGRQQAAFSYMSVQRSYWNFRVALRDNPIQCSCETMGFIRWIISNATWISDFDQLDCLYYNDDRSLNDTHIIAVQLALFCYATLPLTISGSLFGLAMICTLIGYVFYKYRWDVRYYLLKSAQKRRERNLSTKSREYLYDAFVCYGERDTAWVLQELIENLENLRESPESTESESQESLLLVAGEGDRGGQGSSRKEDDGSSSGSTKNDFRLCIKERDFEPGLEIESNILMAIENSRRVIIVLSKDFLNSRWCTLELEMAKMESLVRGVNLIVAIFLEPLEESTKSLEWLVKYYTYLEWFRYDGYRRHEFWRRLRVSLGMTRKRKHWDCRP